MLHFPPLSRRGNLPIRILGSLAALAGFLAVMTFLLPPPEERVAEQENANLKKSESVTNTAAKSEVELGRIIEKMRPGRMGVSTDRATLTDELNTWARTYMKDDEQLARLTNDESVRQQFLSRELLDQTHSERFLPEDVSHIRETMLCRAILDSVGKSSRNDSERLVRVFEFVTRTITPIPDDLKQQLPMTPYESLLFGLGTAADRAWAVAALVSQPPLSMDSVILRPRDPARQDHWLLGIVASDGKISLFDPHEGLSIPAPTDTQETPLPSRAGTLEEVLKDEDLLRRLDVPDSVYPLTAEDLKTAQVQLVGNVSQWAPRMAKLRFLMPGSLTIEVYQGLGPNELRKTGALERLIAAGEPYGWTTDSITLWDHPNRQRSLIESAKGAEGTQLAQYFEVFRGPIVLREDRERGQIYLGASDKSLHFVRMLHLTGNHAQALQDYLPIRSAAQVGADGRPITINLIVADYAAIWSGICQLETGRPTAALHTFERYSKSGLRNMTRAAWEWEAYCHVAEGNYAEAAKVLAESPPGLMPRRDAWLIARWRKLAGQSESPAETPPESLSSPPAKPTPAEEVPPSPDSDKETKSPPQPEAETPSNGKDSSS